MIMFQEMLYLIHENVFKVLTRVRLRPAEEHEGDMHEGQGGAGEQHEGEEALAEEEARSANPFQHKDRTQNLSYSSGGEQSPASMTMKRDQPKVGRNDPCPCGSGKKYKHCHGK